MLVPHCGGQQDNFVFWYGHVRAVLKAMCVWRVFGGNNAASLTSHRVEMDTLETGAGDITD